MHHYRTKYIEVKYYFIRDKVARGDIVFNYIVLKSNLIDIFTKSFLKVKFYYTQNKLIYAV